MDLKSLTCRNCGAALSMKNAKEEVIECPYCKYLTTLPKKNIAPNVATTLRAADHELANADFARAYDMFAKAAELDGNEPEAYFGMALAENQVQYLKDEVNNRLQPICHNATAKKFADNVNYKKAVRLATPKQREVYEKRAKEIDYVRERFAAFAASKLDYDCFICVKVTNEQGDHTEDSYIAERIYHALKKENYRPFYSEEEIGGRTGADYEALILYAICKAKCMLVVCLEEGYLRTKWVKNEYTRFLSISEATGKKSENIAAVNAGKKIERLPDSSAPLRNIEYMDAYGFENVLTFIREFCGIRGSQAKKIRTRVAIVAAAVLALTAVGVGAGIASQKQKEEAAKFGYTYELNAAQDGYVLTGVKGEVTETKFVLPETYEGLPVTAIGRAAFKNVDKMTEIVIPASVTSVGAFAFQDCDGFTNFTLPATVTEWGEGVFQDCDGFTSFNVSFNSIESFAYLFGETGVPTTIAQVTVAGNSLPQNAFKSCGNIAQIAVQSGVTEIGASAFEGCIKLMAITLPDGLLSVGDRAFYGCGSLVTLSLPDSTVSIGDYAFGNCAKLQMLDNSSALTSIGAGAFYHCYVLSQIEIAQSVTEIGVKAFEGCSDLASVNFLATEGWSAGVTALDSAALADKTTAADYLTGNYLGVKWTKTTENE